MEKFATKFLLGLFFIYSAFFFIGSTLAPVLAHFRFYEISAILTSTYMFSCHQQPDRSFWILGYPAALCARCTGFYLGVMAASAVRFFKTLRLNFRIYIILLVLITTDIVLNLVLHTNTGNITRFFTGLSMGFLFIQLLCFIANYILNKKEKNL